VAFCIQDLLALRAVGMPTALARGLERFTPQSLQEFRTALGLAGPIGQGSAGHASAASPDSPIQPGLELDAAQILVPGDPGAASQASHSAATDSPRLILVGWTPSRLSDRRPATLDQVVRNLANTANCLGIALEDVFLWRPEMADIQQIAKCLEIGDGSDVIEAILRNLDQSAKALAKSDDEPESSGSLSEIRLRLREVLLRPGSSPDRRRQQLRKYQRAVEEAYVNPVLELAAAESDPDKRSRLAAMAEANRLLHPSVMLYSARLEKEISLRGLHGDWKALDSCALMKIFDALYKLTKGKK
jgi:hypothetical protein